MCVCERLLLSSRHVCQQVVRHLKVLVEARIESAEKVADDAQRERQA